MTAAELEQELTRRLKTLSERLWENRCQQPEIDAYLGNFDGRHCGDQALERLHALHLLASVSYFGLRELRILLRTLYRDLYRYPLVQTIREQLGGIRDPDPVEERFQDELASTRFLGMGTPAESGTHLLYHFRQVNGLSRKLFAHQTELTTSAASDASAELAPPDLKHIVFIDDLCGSGEQAVRYGRTFLRDLRAVADRRGKQIRSHYLVLFGSTDGMRRAKDEGEFDVVRAVYELDGTYKTFDPESRVFRRAPAAIDPATSQQLAQSYGAELWVEWPLGFEDGQLLLAFHHNVPDNSLPIIWFNEGAPVWAPAFPRFPKTD